MSTHLLLLHGALGTQQQLIPLANLLQEQFTVHHFNFEGHGGRASDAPAFSIDLFVENVLQFLQEQQLERVAIFGYSMGGYVALRLAQKYPQVVEKIVTLGTKFDWSVEAASKEVKMLNPTVIEQKVPKFAALLQKAHAPNDWKMLLDKTAQMMLHLAQESKLTTQDLAQVQQKVLIGICSLDNMVSIAESEEAAAALPHAQLLRIEGFYHPLEKNDMQQLVPLILDFLAS